VEPPFVAVLTGLDTLVEDLQSRGYHVVLAHPERCPALQRDRSMLERLVASGALASVTAGSLAGRFGRTVRRFSLELVRDGLVHNVASDAHGHTQRPRRLPSSYARLDSARWRPGSPKTYPRRSSRVATYLRAHTWRSHHAVGSGGRVELGQQPARPLQPQTVRCALLLPAAPCDVADRLDDDLEVVPRRPVRDVEVVDLDHLGERDAGGASVCSGR